MLVFSLYFGCHPEILFVSIILFLRIDPAPMEPGSNQGGLRFFYDNTSFITTLFQLPETQPRRVPAAPVWHSKPPSLSSSTPKFFNGDQFSHGELVTNQKNMSDLSEGSQLQMSSSLATERPMYDHELARVQRYVVLTSSRNTATDRRDQVILGPAE